MAGGIDWFRWHHGSVTDPKFQLAARRANASLPEVLAVWTYLLEKASAAEVRGCFGEIDAEAIDCLFGMDDGKTAAILLAMSDRKLIGGDCVAAWDKRQPKREREDSSAERMRAYRERQVTPIAPSITDVTPCDASVTQKDPRGEERRGEIEDIEQKPEVFCPQQEIIDAYHAELPTARRIREWTPARQALLRARWREKSDRQTVDWWRKFFAYVGKSDFLCGRSPVQSGRQPFEISLDWLCKSSNFVKVLEGAYES